MNATAFLLATVLVFVYIIGSWCTTFWVNWRAWEEGTYGLGSVLRSVWVGAWWPWYAAKALWRWTGDGN